jgi:hypothetical protein
MKTTKQIRAYIRQCGHKRTNAEMAEKLGISRASFASVLGAMKKSGEIDNKTLKTDVERLERSRAAKRKVSRKSNTTSSNRRG